jgi:hypothetical protein
MCWISDLLTPCIEAPQGHYTHSTQLPCKKHIDFFIVKKVDASDKERGVGGDWGVGGEGKGEDVGGGRERNMYPKEEKKEEEILRRRRSRRNV